MSNIKKHVINNCAVELYDSMCDCDTIYEWQESLESMGNKEKGDLFEYLSYYILKYYHNVSELYLHKYAPAALLDKLNVSHQDRGIDIICKYRQGLFKKYHLIQCKFRSDTSRAVPWREVSTFVGSLFRSNCSKGIFITNCHKVVGDLKHDDIMLIYGDYWDNFNFDDFKGRLEREITGYKNHRWWLYCILVIIIVVMIYYLKLYSII
jgi:hypothetical protein